MAPLSRLRHQQQLAEGPSLAGFSGPATRRGVLGLGIAASVWLWGKRGRAAKSPSAQGPAWAVFYGAAAEPDAFTGIETVILDPGFLGSIAEIAKLGSTPYGYLSLGEIKKSGPWFPHLSGGNVLLDENRSWPGTFTVDVRKDAWRKLMLEQAVPRLLAQGFQGIFLDTLDTPPYLEQLDAVRYGGMHAAAVALVRDIRRAFPDVPLIMNRGYALLPELAGAVDAIVAESLLTTYDFASKSYKWVPDKELKAQISLLRPALSRTGSPLRILSLDYWDPADSQTIRDIYRRERELGHAPYVATILLDQVVREPAA